MGCVKQAGRVAQKRPRAGGRIFICGVGEERPSPSRCVELAFCVASKGQKTNCRIKSSGRETQEGGLPLSVFPPG